MRFLNGWTICDGVWLQFWTAFVLLSGGGWASTAVGSELLSPFFVEGVVSMEAYRPGKPEPYIHEEAKVTFHYSNAWWQVELRRARGTPSVENCMRIPDGTRTYLLFGGAKGPGLPQAWLCPTTYPIPGMTLAFCSWLSLCPNPELPVIDGQRIHRFVNVPTCRVSLITHPQNEGTYSVQYLSPGDHFISELTIANNGMRLEIGGDNEDDVRPFGPPFENGFTELHYQTVEFTNVNGVKFPLRATLQQFSPNFPAKGSDDVYLHVLTRMEVKRISFSAADRLTQSAPPAELFGMDYRPKGLPKNQSVDYLGLKDQWKPASDPEIVRRVRQAIPEPIKRITE